MESTRIHDYSTFGGQLKLFFSRLADWSWLLLPLGFFGTLLFGFIMLNNPSNAGIVAPGSVTTTKPLLFLGNAGIVAPGSVPTTKPLLFLGKSPVTKPGSKSSTELPFNTFPNGSSPGDASNLKNGTFLFRPLHDVHILKLYQGLYLGLTEIQKVYLRKLEVRNIIIDAALLSERLKDSPNLETIILENVAITGNFSRVFLPKLKEFTYIQHRNHKTDFYKQEDILKSILFFDLQEGQTWDLKKDVLNLGVNIKVVIGGTTLVEVNREEGLVTLNVKNCEDIYSNIKPGSQPVTALSLSWCTVTDPIKMPLSTLKYLNLNTAVPDKPILAEIIRGASQLESFHAFLPFACDNASWISPDIPEIMIFTNFTEFSDTIRTVSLSKLAIYSLPEDYVSPITNLILETVNVTGILTNFHKNFANLTKVAVFNATVDDGYTLLKEILMTQAESILMQDFPRSTAYSEVEAVLKKSGIPDTETNFLLEKDPATGIRTGRSINAFERHFNRFNLLEFNDMESYADYSVWDAVYK